MTEPDQAAKARLAQAIAGARAKTLALLDAKTDEIVALVRRAQGSDWEDARRTLRLRLHNLAGSSPTIGLAALGAEARRLEVELDATPNGPFSEQEAQRFERAVDALRTLTS